MLVTNPAADPEPRDVRVQLHAVAVPHRELPLGVAAIRPSGRGISCPHLERVQEVELTLQLAASEPLQITDEIAIDVVRMVLVLGE